LGIGEVANGDALFLVSATIDQRGLQVSPVVHWHREIAEIDVVVITAAKEQ
jgi:hypothetical protein